MEAQLKELLDFLHDRNPNVRQIALSNLLGHTAKESPYRNLFYGTGLSESTAIRDLKLLCRDQPVSNGHPIQARTQNQPDGLGYCSRCFCCPCESCRRLACQHTL
jgi:hypothetical protein